MGAIHLYSLDASEMWIWRHCPVLPCIFPVLPCVFVLSCLAFPCPVLPFIYVMSCLAFRCPVLISISLPCLVSRICVLSCRAFPCPILPCISLSYLALHFLAASN